MKRKNLVYIFADQWRKSAMGFEEDVVLTPNIDAFAKEAMVFNNAISTYPLCSPHRASLLTGKYPYSCGVWTNCKTGIDEIVMLKPQETTIANVLKENGYNTGYIGKWHLDASELNFTENPKSGAIGWDAYTPPGERRQGFDFWYSYGAMNKHLNPHYWQDDCQKIEPKRWSAEVETDVAINYINEQETDIPFCLFISWNPPHPPYDQVPQKYLDMYNDVELRANVHPSLKNDDEFIETTKQYYAAITGLDENFQRVLDCLKAKNMEDDTIVVLSSDHGEMLGSHGLMQKNIWYEESINIPFIVRGKDIQCGKTEAVFGSIDHMPTLLDMLEVEIPKSVQGQSFKSIIEGVDTENELGEVAFICMLPGMDPLLEPFRKRGLNHKAFGWRGIRTKTFTYVVDNGCHPDEGKKRYLYDLKNDPYQMNPQELKSSDNRIPELDAILKRFLEEQKDPFIL